MIALLLKLLNRAFIDVLVGYFCRSLQTSPMMKSGWRKETFQNIERGEFCKVRTKREMSWMGLENSHVGRMGQYSMENVSVIVMYGEASLEGPMWITLDLF